MKEIGNYNFRKAIQEARNNNLSGLELEMHREAQLTEQNIPTIGHLRIPQIVLQRANEMTSTLGITQGHSPIDIYNKPFDKVAPYKAWGVTELENLSGITEIPMNESNNFAKLGEGQLVSQITGYKGKAVLAPNRFQGYQDYTNEYLAETAAVNLLMSDAIYQTSRAIAKDLINKALLNNPAEPVNADNYDALMRLISNKQGILNPAFVTSDENYLKALGYERSVGNGFIINPIDYNYGKLKGVNIFGTDLITESATATIIFADWAKSFVGLFGGLQVIVDPYTRGDEGITRVNFIRFADTAINNLTTISVVENIV